jgi:hypothetical protein
MLIAAQRDLVYAYCALLNFMQLQGEDIDTDHNLTENLAEEGTGYFRREMAGDRVGGENEEEVIDVGDGGQDSKGMKAFRDRIARDMWQQYLPCRRDNGYED